MSKPRTAAGKFFWRGIGGFDDRRPALIVGYVDAGCVRKGDYAADFDHHRLIGTCS